jgi:hypothetical protein
MASPVRQLTTTCGTSRRSSASAVSDPYLTDCAASARTTFDIVE